MWPPADPYSLPSKNEIEKIGGDILHLEAELLELVIELLRSKATYSLGELASLQYAGFPMNCCL